MAIQRKPYAGMAAGGYGEPQLPDFGGSIPPPPEMNPGTVAVPPGSGGGQVSPGTANVGTPTDDGHLPPLPGSSEGPRDKPIPLPPTQNAPGGVERKGLPGAAPSMPMSPSPVSAMSPRPFTPLTPPRGMSGAALAPSSHLLGKAGGLLGGGLGVPGQISGVSQDISDLIQMLMQTRGGA